MNQEETLFYTDLVYHIRKLAGLITNEDPEREERIVIREKDKKQTDENGNPTYFLSDFTLALFAFTLNVSRKAECMLNGPSDLHKYPEEVKEAIKDFYLKIAEDYSETPGGRYIDGGPASGEDFRDNVLEPKYLECLSNNQKLVIDFDGGYGYSTGFLEEAFGGMIRKGYNCKELLEHMVFIYTEEPDRIAEIITYMEEEQERLDKEGKKVKAYTPPKD